MRSDGGSGELGIPARDLGAKEESMRATILVCVLALAACEPSGAGARPDVGAPDDAELSTPDAFAQGADASAALPDEAAAGPEAQPEGLADGSRRSP